jgi:hypothetical protein
MMNTGTVKLMDQSRNVLAVARVALEDDHYAGTIDLTCTPPALKALFAEFEEIVDGQMFSFLDEIQEKIGAVPITAVFDNGDEGAVSDLQVFPSAGDVSFSCCLGVPLMTSAHRIEAVLAEDGKLLLDHLPFQAGQAVEVIVIPASRPIPTSHALRGTVLRYDQPTAPVADADWGALR